jgi:hypothetical protein
LGRKLKSAKALRTIAKAVLPIELQVQDCWRHLQLKYRHAISN